jgi:hypothetical protein
MLSCYQPLGRRAAAAPGSSTQRGARVSGEEAFDSPGSFLGCLLRISSAQLASLDSIRDCLIDLRWYPRLTSTAREYHVLKYFHRGAAVSSFRGPFLQSRFSRRNVAVRLGTPVNDSLNGVVLHRTYSPNTELCRFLGILALRIGDEGPSAEDISLLPVGRQGQGKDAILEIRCEFPHGAHSPATQILHRAEA